MVNVIIIAKICFKSRVSYQQVSFMIEKNKKFYITTSIAYTNAVPHCGFALEVIQADVIARFHRILGEDVLFLTGTDEHGSKIARASQEADKSPIQFTDEISARFQKLKETLNLSNDDFIRTTDQKRHWPSVEKVWNQLLAQEDIYKKQYKGFYCVGCEAFLVQRELIDGKCPIHKKDPEIVEEENYFFKLSQYQSQLKDILEKNKIQIFPQARKNEMLGFIKEGLEDISCSRVKEKLQWGIPAPNDDTQIVYVWFEALINYISALDYAVDGAKFKKYWPVDVHCIGKDISRFHLLLWPAMLLALGLELPKSVLIHGFINVAGEKMSKSLGNVVDPFELIGKYTQKIGNKEAAIDALRYFLLREISPTEDGDFTYEKFEERYNADLANGIGNLVARVTALATKLKIKNENIKTTIKNEKLNAQVGKTKKGCAQFLEEFKFNEALGAIWELISFCDKYVNEQKPWEGKESSKEVISDLLLAISQIAELLKPFLPQTSERIVEQLKTGKSTPLFPRIS